jgi:cell division protein FtsI/penicillin-binding protein 2
MHQSGAFRGSGGCGWCGRTADLVNPLSLAAEAAAIEHGHDRCHGEGRPSARVCGKTGTAHYGNGPSPPSHGWFIGYRGDLAFAVLVEGVGLGAGRAGPIASAFLRKL